jgi:hypothetical protein
MEKTEFSPAELCLFVSVLRQACADVESADDVVRSKIANRILSMACDGERDFEILRSQATRGLCKGGKVMLSGTIRK